MKLTNRLGLPQPIVDAVANDPYSRGEADISVTGLLRPPRIAALEKQHLEELEEDVADRIYSLVGQVIHGLLERANTIGVAERRLYTTIEGWKISGGMDRYHDGVLQDYKFVTSYKFKAGVPADEFIEQLNCYAQILRDNGFPVHKLELVGILRDWSKLEARRDSSYPQQQVVVLDVPLWPEDFTKKFMRERVILHKQAAIKLPECTPEEKWEKPTTWAVMKPGQKKAVRVFDNETMAQTYAMAAKGTHVVKRPGESVRCSAYCPVANFCTQYQSTKKQVEEEVNEVQA